MTESTMAGYSTDFAQPTEESIDDNQATIKIINESVSDDESHSSTNSMISSRQDFVD